MGCNKNHCKKKGDSEGNPKWTSVYELSPQGLNGDEERRGPQRTRLDSGKFRDGGKSKCYYSLLGVG